jgi:DNA-directed RNA polymerase I subunit RPA1
MHRLLTSSIVGAGFSFYSDDEIRRMSVKRLTNPQTFDSFGHPTPDGVYDKALGPVDYKDVCPTCTLPFAECPGHLGHIELAVPVYNPSLFTLLYKLLRLKCFSCHKLRIASARARVLKIKLMLLDLGRYEEAMSLDARIAARPIKEVLGDAMAHSGGNEMRKTFGAAAGKKGKKGSKSSSSAEAAEGEAPMPEDEAHGESTEDAVKRQDALLTALEMDCLAQGGPDVGLGLLGAGSSNAGRGVASSGPASTQHLREYREALIKEFMFAFPAKTCHNCGATAVPIKKDGYSKLFLKPLPKKVLIEAASSGIYYRSATAVLKERQWQRKQALKRLAKRRAQRAAGKAVDVVNSAAFLDGSGSSAGLEPSEAADLALLKKLGADASELSTAAAASSSNQDDDDEEEYEPEDEFGLFGISLNALDNGEVSDDEGDASKSAASGKQRYIAASEVAGHMQLLWESEYEVLRRIWLPIRSAPLAGNGITPIIGGATASASAPGGDAGMCLRSLIPRPASRATLASIQQAKYGTTTNNSGAGPGPSHSIPHPRDGWRFFFMHVLPVPPSRFRPPQVLNEQSYEHPQNVYLTKIIKANDLLIDLGLGRAQSYNTNAGNSSSSNKGGKDGIVVDLRRAIATWMDLQNSVNGLLDSTKATSMQKGGNKNMPNGIRQLLEKKEGIFRKNMMGKRVNFAARSVISPDPYLRTDQVGVPVRFAKTLTFKQPITRFNVRLLAQLVRNGPSVWPGATHVEFEDGSVVDLTTRDGKQREAIAKMLMVPVEAANPIAFSSATGIGLLGGPASSAAPGALSASGLLKAGGGAASSAVAAAALAATASVSGSNSSALATRTPLDTAAAGAAAASGGLAGTGVRRVWRHLLDDDIVLMNRQPTLHKPSIMAHRTRVMRHWSSQQCIRFHYANCKTYNADFDGDEVRSASFLLPSFLLLVCFVVSL